MCLDVIRGSFYTVGNLFNPEDYILRIDSQLYRVLIVLLVISPIILYGLSNLLFWFFGERKLEREVVVHLTRSKVKKIVSPVILYCAAFVGVTWGDPYISVLSADTLLQYLINPFVYTCFVLGFIAFIKYTIGNIVKLIVGAVKSQK